MSDRLKIMGALYLPLFLFFGLAILLIPADFRPKISYAIFHMVLLFLTAFWIVKITIVVLCGAVPAVRMLLNISNDRTEKNDDLKAGLIENILWPNFLHPFFNSFQVVTTVFLLMLLPYALASDSTMEVGFVMVIISVVAMFVEVITQFFVRLTLKINGDNNE